jgi:hypothetical protein
MLLPTLPYAAGQTTTARVVGTVTDGTGASVPEAPVVVQNVETGQQRTARTNASGDFVVTNLQVGRYTITVSLAGFKEYQRGPFELQVDQTARIDISLELGKLAEKVTVSSDAPLVESETATLGQVIEREQIRELPLNGRNFVQLGQLIPGSTTGPPGATTVPTREGGQAITINGQRVDQNNWMLDGVDNNAGLYGMVVVVPSLDSIREFKIQASNYSAEFGRAGGGVISVETRSGSNQFHGSLFEYLRNSKLDSPDYFAPLDTAGRKIKSPLVFNQFGGSLGGPVFRNRTFFFVNYEGKRIHNGVSTGSLDPTAAMKQGNFVGQPTIYDPLNLDPTSKQRLPFANNAIPASRINASSAKMLGYFPDPNSSDPARNYVRIAPGRDDYDQFHVRVDHRFSERQWIMGRLSWYNTDTVTGNAFPLDADILDNYHRSVAFQYTQTFSTNLVNEFRFGFNRYHFLYTDETAGQPLTAQFGLPDLSKGTIYDGFPDTRITGLARMGGNAAVPLDRVEQTIQFIDNVTWIKGNHTIRAGGDIRPYRPDNFQPSFARGRYEFSGIFTGATGKQYSNGFADFLLGDPSRQSLSNPNYFLGTRLHNTRYSAYLQDDWKVSRHLTLNLGLRFEREGAWTERDNNMGSFDAGTGQIVYPKDYKLPAPLPFAYRIDTTDALRPANNGLGPRVGFAYRPFGNTDLVIRGGYGIFTGANTGQPFLQTPPPVSLQEVRTNGSTAPDFTMGQTSLTGTNLASLIPAQPSGTVLSYHSPGLPYTQQWNMTVEAPVGKSMSGSIAYVGNRTIRLYSTYQGNPALPPAPGNLQARRRFPNVGSITLYDSDSYSNYNALQTRLERRFSKGLNLLATYTWSKTLDNNGGEGESNGAGYQDPSRRNLAYGLSGQDIRHRFTAAAVYQLPLHSSVRPLNAVVRDWQTNAVINLRRGFPFTPVVSGDTPNAGAGTVHPNGVGANNGNLSSGRNINHWFDTGAFVAPPPYTFGTAGRNILIGPGAETFDLGLARNFPIHERHRVQFRGELFNAFNHPNFGFPGATFNTVTFGLIRSAATQRQIQFSLRYDF